MTDARRSRVNDGTHERCAARVARPHGEPEQERPADGADDEESAHQTLQDELAEMGFVPLLKLGPRVRVARAADVLQYVRGRDRSETGARLVRRAGRKSFHEPAAIRVADT